MDNRKMGLDNQVVLLEMPEQAEVEARAAASRAAAELRTVNREQSMPAHIRIDELIGPDHAGSQSAGHWGTDWPAGSERI